VAGFWRKLIASSGANHPVVQEDQEFQQKPTQLSKELLSESKCKKRAGEEWKGLLTREGRKSAAWVYGVKLGRPKADGALTSEGTPTWVWSRERKFRKNVNLWGKQPSDNWYMKGWSTRCLFLVSVFTDGIFAQAPAPPSLLGRERDGGQWGSSGLGAT